MIKQNLQEKINTDFSSLPIKLFFTKVFKAALEKNQVTATLICDCIVLLGNMTQSDNVPDDAVIKGISIYLCTFPLILLNRMNYIKLILIYSIVTVETVY